MTSFLRWHSNSKNHLCYCIYQQFVSVSTWAGWIMFPRILSIVCQQVGWAPRHISVWNLEGRSGAAGIWDFFPRPFHSWHMLKLISWINWLVRGSSQDYNCFTFPWTVLQFLWFLGQVCSSMCQRVTSPTGYPHHQGWRQWQVTWVSVHPHGF